jgi:hypothetical protein
MKPGSTPGFLFCCQCDNFQRFLQLPDPKEYMRTLTLIFPALLLALALLLPSCDSAGKNSKKAGPTPEEILIGSWKLKSLNMSGEPAPPQIMVTSSFNFYKDGNYEILMGELDRGTWSLSADKRILITVPQGGGGLQNHIDLERVTAEEVVLYNPQGPNPVRMVLVPAE